MKSKYKSARVRAGLLTLAIAAAVVPAAAFASQAGADVVVTPSSNDLTLGAGDVFGPENVNVAIPAGERPSAADVYFLADNTGSMGGPIASVKAAATATVSGLQSSLTGVDLAFGVSDYRDGQGCDPYNFRVDQAPTTNVADVQTGINAWTASGGCDNAEGQIEALDELAVSPTVGWRAGAERIVVWFGDCPGHSPQLGITEAQATADLQAAHITVMAIGTNTGCVNALNGTDDGAVAGQANRITAATGGTYVSGVSSSTIVDAITTAVNSAVTNINSVSLVPSATVASYVTSIAPTQYGPLDGNTSHSLDFQVTFTGTHCGPTGPETVTGSLDVMADGSKVGEKTVTIHVPACNPCVAQVSTFDQPINSDNSSNFKLGSTIPVKVRITCNGVALAGVSPDVDLVRVDSTPSGDVNEVISSSAADTGDNMRPADGKYIFNLSTKRSQFNAGADLTAGTYKLTIDDSDAVVPAFNAFSVNFDLRK